MQCSICGAPIQQGMAFCPNCGTPYASAQSMPGAAPRPPAPYEPTVAAPSSYDPTVASQPYTTGNNGQAFSPPVNSLSSASQSGYADYNGQAANPYAPQPPSMYSAQSGYNTPPPPPNAFNPGTPLPSSAMYGAPYAPVPGAPVPPVQPGRKKGPNVGLIIGIAVLLVVIIVGGVLALKGARDSGSPTVGPSGSPVDSASAGIITNVQTTSSIDGNYLPTNVTNQFKVGQVVYVTYRLNLTQSGYVEAKVYADGVYGTQTSLQVTLGKVDHGYFNITYRKAGSGAFELYWCVQADCSDAKLAAVATFTVA